MRNRLEEIVELIEDLAEFDRHHILLEPYELAVVRLVESSGKLSFSLFDATEMSEDNVNVNIKYSLIKPHLIRLFIDSVLLVKHLQLNSKDKITIHTDVLPKFKDTFGLEMANTLVQAVSALTDSVVVDEPSTFIPAYKLLVAFIYSMLDLYNIPKDIFYEEIEEYVFTELTVQLDGATVRSSNKLTLQFKGNITVELGMKIDRRKRVPFVGFNAVINGKTHLFSSSSPYKSFLDLSRFVEKNTTFDKVRFTVGPQAKEFIDRYDVVFIKENVLVENMQKGFCPVLAPRGVKDIEGFLDVLIK